MQRYFSNKLEENILFLSDDDLYHIKKVMRMKLNDQIEVVYDKKLYLCCLEDVNQRWGAKILNEKESNTRVGPKVNLIIPFLKEQKMDYIFQKAVELGVDTFTIVPFERSIIKLDEVKLSKKIDRWQKICKEASEQSMRITIPNIVVLKKLTDLDSLEGVKLVCSTNEKQNYIKKLLKKNYTCDTINLVIGPEGGITDNEESLLESHSFIKVTLGSQILRVETVPLYLMSIIQYEYSE